MADGKFLIGKPSGGVTTVTIVDGASNTNLVLPESGTVATQAYADGKTTLAQVKAEISTGSNLVTSPTGIIGYGTGAGGVVTQLTSKSTSVTLNKPTGTIIMNSSSLAGGANVTFILNNSLISLVDGLLCTLYANSLSSQGAYRVTNAVANGVAYITLTNQGGTTYSDNVYINFSLKKGATA